MARLRQRKDGRYFIDYRENGQRRCESLSIDGVPIRDEAVARAYFEQWKEDSKPDATPVTSPRIAEILRYYQEVHLPASNAAAATYSAVQTHCEEFRQWCKARRIGNISQLSGETMTRWSADLQKNVGPRTAGNYLRTIRTAFNAAVHADILERNPVRKWKFPKVDPVEKHPLSLTEWREVLEMFKDIPIVQWMVLTGNRPSDARTLRFRQVDIPTRTVDRGSQKPRDIRKYEITVAAAALVAREAIRPHRPEDVVFLNRLGRPWSENGLLKAMKTRTAEREYPRHVTPKQLRDSFASIMANDIGIPLPALQVLMGHTDIKTTMKYVRARGARTFLDRLESELL